MEEAAQAAEARVADEGVHAVVASFTPSFSYQHLANAACYLQTPCKANGGTLPVFVATNRDAGDRIGRYVLPASGPIVAAVGVAAGRDDVVDVGKPSTELMRTVLTARRLDASRTLMVGDRLDTDVLWANASGVSSLLVLTGVSSASDASRLPPGDPRAPRYVSPSLASALKP